MTIGFKKKLAREFLIFVGSLLFIFLLFSGIQFYNYLMRLELIKLEENRELLKNSIWQYPPDDLEKINEFYEGLNKNKNLKPILPTNKDSLISILSFNNTSKVLYTTLKASEHITGIPDKHFEFSKAFRLSFTKELAKINEDINKYSENLIAKSKIYLIIKIGTVILLIMLYPFRLLIFGVMWSWKVLKKTE